MTKNILLTCANSQVGPAVLSLMQQHPDHDVRIIGGAAGNLSNGLGPKYCDAFHELPMGAATEYWSAVCAVIEKEDIDLIFPGSDEEALVLSKHAGDLSERNCKVACSSHEACIIASDKLTLVTRLETSGIPVGRYASPQKSSDIVRFAKACGYPDNEVVIKPRFGRGSRGFRVLSEKANEYNAFCNGLKGYATLEQIEALFLQYPEHVSEYILMEYLPGDKYSSDMLVSRGNAVCTVIRCNGHEPKVSPPTQLADIVYDADIEDYARRVAAALEADYFLQVECGRDANGQVKIIETNIRLDATLPITVGVGVNYYHEMMTYAFEGSFRSLPRLPGNNKPLRFIRYWQHEFIEI